MKKQKLLSSLPSVDEIKKIIKEHEVILKEKYKVKEMGIFGSYVRGETKKVSELENIF